MKPLFDKFRTSFATSWPVHETRDTSDVTVAEEYDAPFVWLKHVDAPVKPDFDYTWRPAPANANNIFEFPICDKTLRPYTWDSMRLVPTKRNDNTNIIRMNIPAGVYDFDYSVLILGTARDNIKPFLRKFCNAMYLGTPATKERVAGRINLLTHTEHTLVFHDHVDPGQLDLSGVNPEKGVLYLFNTTNLLTGESHVSSNVMLVPNGTPTAVEVVDINVASNYTTSTPDNMWKRGFLDAHVMMSLGESIDKIADQTGSSGPLRFYVKGFKAALDNPQEFDIKTPWFGSNEIDALYDALK